MINIFYKILINLFVSFDFLRGWWRYVWFVIVWYSLGNLNKE